MKVPLRARAIPRATRELAECEPRRLCAGIERRRALEARSRFFNAVSLKLANPELIPAARNALGLLPEVASTELDEKNGRITAFPAPGKLPLASINALAERQHWPLAELHLESGRLDEVFRSITGGATA